MTPEQLDDLAAKAEAAKEAHAYLSSPKNHQQLDMDGCFVGVSRQALKTFVAALSPAMILDLIAELRKAQGELEHRREAYLKDLAEVNRIYLHQIATLRAEVERHKAAHEQTAEELHMWIRLHGLASTEIATLRAQKTLLERVEEAARRPVPYEGLGPFATPETKP